MARLAFTFADALQEVEPVSVNGDTTLIAAYVIATG